jgi:hypothetical protein
MKKIAISILAFIFLASVSACQAVVVRPQTQIDPAHPWVVPLDQEAAPNYSCETIWICQPVNITASVACDYLVFDFTITNTATNEVLVRNARSYWGAVPAGLTQVEFGYNNAVFNQTSFSTPVATCLDKQPDEQTLKSLQEFPSSFCEKGIEYGCSASSLTAWELDRMSREAESKEGSDYTGGSGYEVTCEDGWISESGGIQGACSHHGGVAD